MVFGQHSVASVIVSVIYDRNVCQIPPPGLLQPCLASQPDLEQENTRKQVCRCRVDPIRHAGIGECNNIIRLALCRGAGAR